MYITVPNNASRLDFMLGIRYWYFLEHTTGLVLMAQMGTSSQRGLAMGHGSIR